MATKPRTHRDIMKILGGPTAVARSLGLEPVNTTVHWPTRGVPARYRQRLSERLAAHGVHLDSDGWDSLVSDSSLPDQGTTTSQSQAAA